MKRNLFFYCRLINFSLSTCPHSGSFCFLVLLLKRTLYIKISTDDRLEIVPDTLRQIFYYILGSASFFSFELYSIRFSKTNEQKSKREVGSSLK